MSDLIQSVVEEILQKKGGLVADSGSGRPAAAMTRPNYQRQKADARMAQLHVPVAAKSVGRGGTLEALSAEMRRSCLTHECDRAPRIVSRRTEGGTANHCEVIGRIGGSSGIWWIAEPDERALTDRVRQVWDGEPMAVVSLTETVPHQVLLIDEMIHALDGSVRIRIGEKGTDGSLMIGIGHPDQARLKGQLKKLANGLGRAQYPHKEAYLLEYPCAFVQRLLGIGAEPAMGVLLDVSELDGVLIADWIYRNVQDAVVTVTVKSGWLLLTGAVEDVHKGLDTAKWYRDRVRN